MTDKFDVAVIGGGPAGYVAAIRAAQLGAKIVLFERDEVGGTCLNRGCVPTKAFLQTAEAIASFKRAPERGLVFSPLPTVSVDMPKVVKHKNGIVRKLTGGVSDLLRSNGVTLVKGNASLSTSSVVICEGKDYEAGSIILCGGSRATRIPISGIDNPKVITSDELLDIDHVPGKLLIIGAGIVGCEFAIPFAQFGSQVTMVEATDRVTPALDPELSAGIENGMKRIGINVLKNSKVESISDRDGRTFVTVSGKELESDCILLCVGRSPELSCLGKLAEKLEMEAGHVAVDDFCRTNLDGIYACGDISNRSGLASSAIKMGEAAAENAMGHRKAVDLSKVPNIIHTDPEAVSVGMSEADAREMYGAELLIGKFPFSGNGMSLASGKTEGFVKVLAEKKYGEIVGVHVLGGNAAEMSGEISCLMTAEITVYEAADIIHAHPTMSEALMEACADAIGRCIHLPGKRK